MRRKIIKSDIEDLKQVLNRTIESKSDVPLCEGYILGLSTKLDRLIVKYMEIDSDSNVAIEEDLNVQTI